jgi:hypothetical protein
MGAPTDNWQTVMRCAPYAFAERTSVRAWPVARRSICKISPICSASDHAGSHSRARPSIEMLVDIHECYGPSSHKRPKERD